MIEKHLAASPRRRQSHPVDWVKETFIEGRWWVQAFFRHPKSVQKNASEYIELIKSVGFQVDAAEVKCSRPWWSRRFWGLAQLAGLNRRAEPSELLCVARKPA